MLGNLEIAIERVDFAGRPFAEGKLVDAVGEIIGIVVDH